MESTVKGFDKLIRQVGKVRDSEPGGQVADNLLADESVEKRKNLIVQAGSELFDKGPRRDQYVSALCKLHQNPQDSGAWDHVLRVAKKVQDPDTGSPQFIISVLSRISRQLAAQVSSYRIIPPPIVEKLKKLEQAATAYQKFLSKSGVENSAAMNRTAGYLFGEQFPDSVFYHGITGERLAQECKEFMCRYGQTLFEVGMCEYLSPVYHALNTAAWLNAAEFAQDEEAQTMADAILTWLLVDYALNYHHGRLLPPLMRSTDMLTTNLYLRIRDIDYENNLNSYQMSYARQGSQWIGWLYWGGGNTPQEESLFNEPLYTIHWPHGLDAIKHAVSKYTPHRIIHQIIRSIGAKRIRTPYMVWQSHGTRRHFFEAQVNRYGYERLNAKDEAIDENPQYHMRSAYVARNYSMGVLYRRNIGTDDSITQIGLNDSFTRIGGPLASVSWESTDHINWLIATHPYWYTARQRKFNRPSGDNDPTAKPLGSYDWMAASPFGQAVHWENAAVLLFSIPHQDPWSDADINDRGSEATDSQRLNPPIQAVYVYYPETMDEESEVASPMRSDAFFMRKGQVYIAIRAFHARGLCQPRSEPGGHDGFRRLVIPGGLVGLALEVGDATEYGSFANFKHRVAATHLDLSSFQPDKRVVYETTRNHVLEIQYNPNDWLPKAQINHIPLEFDCWPLYQSPYVTCRDRVLTANDGEHSFTIDWNGDLPQYTVSTLSQAHSPAG